jgi:CHAT domain-containing protein
VGGVTPALDLKCSTALADAAGDVQQAAIANLTYAHDLLAMSDTTSGSAADSRQLAGVAALHSLQPLAASSSGMSSELAGRLIETAIDAGEAGDPRLEPAIEAMKAGQPDDPAVQAYAAALSGRIAQAAGQPDIARRWFEQAIYLEGQRAAPLRLSDWYMLLAAVDPKRHDSDILSAYAALQSVRTLLPLREPFTEESTFELHMRGVFKAAVDVTLTEGGDADSVAQIGLAQQIVESYRQAEFESLFGSQCVPPSTPIQPGQLRSGEVILYPILLDDRVELIYAAGSDGGVYRRLTPNRASNGAAVPALVATMRASIVSHAPGDEKWRQASRALYDLLIAPIQDKLGPQSTLIILPDGPLRTLPFTALLDANGKFLIERTRLAVAPALAFSQPGPDRAGRNAAIVAGALSKEVRIGGITYPKLEGAADEALAATQSYGANNRQGVLISDLTAASLVSALSKGQVDVLHLATHAAFNGQSDQSYIVVDTQLVPLSTLRALIVGNRARGDELDLIVLSACETALGDDQASMGLAGAAVQAGAHSAIASLWSVNDASTALLMKAFYARYRSGDSKSEALRQAQLSLLADPRYQRPNYWAAFALIGGWR